MGHLAFNHFSLQFFDTYDVKKIDITGAQMVLVMKLTAFAWNIHDGRQPESELTAYQKTKAVRVHPPLINFISYAFFYPSILTGPAFDYRDYEQWLNSDLFTDLPESKKPGKKRKRSIPKSGRVAFYRVAQAVGWLLIWQKSGDYVSFDHIFDSDFRTHALAYKILYLYFLAFTYRLKYYAAWTISEASCILAGLGYNGYDPKTKSILWNRVQNIDIFAFETSQNIHGALEAWNQNTNKWLKHYVYLRVATKGSKPGFKTTFVTFLTSAFWHGTRPGYYLSFATGALMQSCGKIYRRIFRPIFLEEDGITGKPSKIFYDIVTYIVTQISLGYLVQPFVILDFKQSLSVWSSVYYFIHIGIFTTLFVFNGPFKKQVISFLKQYHPVTKQSKATTIKNEENNDTEEKDAIHLGIPEADFENADISQIVDELHEFQKDYKKWQESDGIEEESKQVTQAIHEFQHDLEKLKQSAQHDKKKD
jgi:lysophospholipid acyltransferase